MYLVTKTTDPTAHQRTGHVQAWSEYYRQIMHAAVCSCGHRTAYTTSLKGAYNDHAEHVAERS